MESKKDDSIEIREVKDAKVMADLIVDPNTSDHLRVTIINKLLETRENPNFFDTMFEEKMSFGECPCCGLELHWAIPEDALNKMGWVTHEKDPGVPKHTSEEICPEWEESCAKKKITV